MLNLESLEVHLELRCTFKSGETGRCSGQRWRYTRETLLVANDATATNYCPAGPQIGYRHCPHCLSAMLDKLDVSITGDNKSASYSRA